jgi:hypothetical protein
MRPFSFCFREGLQQARLVVKTLGSGFHIPAEGVHYLSRVSNIYGLTSNILWLVTWWCVRVFHGMKSHFVTSWKALLYLIVSGEGPRSRRYGRTAAMRLTVQPCDDDDDDYYYYYFVLFLVMEHRWNEIDRGKPKYSGKNLSQCHFVHHKSHMA